MHHRLIRVVLVIYHNHGLIHRGFAKNILLKFVLDRQNTFAIPYHNVRFPRVNTGEYQVIDHITHISQGVGLAV